MLGTEAGNQGRAPSPLIWHQGSMVPYESLWGVLHRIGCLNILYPSDLSFLHSRLYGYRGMSSLIVNHKLVDLLGLAECLEEPRYLFRLSTLEDLRPWTYALFHKFSLKYCPLCLAAGFHSALHGLKTLRRCPIHDVELVQHCDCGKAISACLNQELFAAPNQCGCGRMQFYDQAYARRPGISGESAEAFDELARWLEASSRRVYMMCDHSHERLSAYDAGTHRLISVWSKLIRMKVPEGIDLNAIPGLTMRNDITVGGPFRDSVAPLSNSQGTTNDLRTLVFHAIDRHIRRHVLQGQKWITRLCMSSDSDYILDSISKSSDARLAWSYLLWLLSVFGGSQLQDLRSRNAKKAYRHGLPLPRVSAYEPSGPCTQTMHNWIEMHATAAYLASLWASSIQLGLGMVATRNVAWGDALINCRQAFRWVAALQSKNQIAIGTSIFEGASIRSCTKGRIEGNSPTAGLSKIDRCLADMPTLGLAKCLNGEWISGALTPPDPDDRDIKIQRLLGVSSRFHFILIPVSDGATLFVARLVEHGMEAWGKSPREAISSLRSGVQLFQKVYGSEWMDTAAR